MLNSAILNNQWILSLILVVIVLVLRKLIVIVIYRRPTVDDEYPRRWANSINNIATLLIVIGLVIIWLSELRHVALSIAAFAVAIVLATREFIQCFIGSLYLTSTRTFSVGDWIRLGNQYGEVVQSDWLSTTLLEIDMESSHYEYTGKTLVIPNNQFVASTIHNLNFMRRYVAHTFSITRDADSVDVYQLKAPLLEKASDYCKEFHEVAERYTSLVEKRLGISLGVIEPTIRVSTTPLGKNMMSISIFCPTKEALLIEQKITEDFMSLWYQKLKEVKLAQVGKLNDSESSRKLNADVEVE